MNYNNIFYLSIVLEIIIKELCLGNFVDVTRVKI